MYPLATPFPYLEVAAFVVALITFLLTVRFFIDSQKMLQGLLSEKSQSPSSSHSETDRDGFLLAVKPRKTAAAKERKADAGTKR